MINPPVEVIHSSCGIPATAEGYVFNATVVPSPNLSYLTLWPDTLGQPVVSTLNAADGWITSNMAIVPNVNGKIDAYASGITQLILDISAYFAP
jgi:hypothetical protein